MENFGVPKSTLCIFLNIIFPSLKCSSLKHLWDLIVFGKTKKIIVREVITKKVVKNKTGNKTYLLKDKESHIVATSEIYGANELPRDIYTFTNELQQVLHDVGKRIISNIIKSKSTQRYDCRLIQRVNR